MRLLISAGGTGGHVYPALAVINSLQAIGQAPQVLWVGTRGGMEADLVRRTAIPYVAIDGSAVVGVGLFRAAVGLLRVLTGAWQALAHLARFRPQVIFVTGGFSAVAVALAGWLRRIPVAVYLPDIEPGHAIQVVSRFASLILVTDAASQQYFPNKAVEVTGYPVRPELLSATRDEAQTHFGLTPNRPTLLVTGGSRGARSINQAILAGLSELLPVVQILHISGQTDWPTVAAGQAALPTDLQAHYHAYPYLHEDMGLAYAAADLVVARSGASALGELPAFGAASILVPYPYAWRYQKVNADVLAKHGAAIRIDDEKLASELVPSLLSIFAQPDQLAQMRQAASRLARPDAALAIGRALQNLAQPPAPTAAASPEGSRL